MMEKAKTLLIVATLCLSLVGCAFLREKAVWLSEEDLANAETVRGIAKNNLETWPLKSGILHGAVGSRLDEWPVEAVEAIKELDQLAEKYLEGELTDWELGYTVGLKVRLLGVVVMEAVKRFAPDILEVYPSLIL